MTTGVLVLAAGFSRRFGSDKRLYRPAGGQSLLQLTLANVLAAELPCRVAIRTDDSAVDSLLRALPLQVLRCQRAGEGMGATLAEAVSHCHDWDGLLVMLADMAWVQARTLIQLAAALDPESIVQPCYEQQAGNPVGFGRSLYPQLEDLQGDRGGRVLLQANISRLRQISVSDAGVLRDLDQPPTPLEC